MKPTKKDKTDFSGKLVGDLSAAISQALQPAVKAGASILEIKLSGTIASPGGVETSFDLSHSKGGARIRPKIEAAEPVELFAITRPSYATLATSYNCSGTHACSMTFPNTCAIRLSEALVSTTASWTSVFRASGKNLCPHHFVRGAQDLGGILAS